MRDWTVAETSEVWNSAVISYFRDQCHDPGYSASAARFVAAHPNPSARELRL